MLFLFYHHVSFHINFLSLWPIPAVVCSAYHGHTQLLIDFSSYKHKHPGYTPGCGEHASIVSLYVTLVAVWYNNDYYKNSRLVAIFSGNPSTWHWYCQFCFFWKFWKTLFQIIYFSTFLEIVKDCFWNLVLLLMRIPLCTSIAGVVWVIRNARFRLRCKPLCRSYMGRGLWSRRFTQSKRTCCPVLFLVFYAAYTLG